MSTPGKSDFRVGKRENQVPVFLLQPEEVWEEWTEMARLRDKGCVSLQSWEAAWARVKAILRHCEPGASCCESSDGLAFH